MYIEQECVCVGGIEAVSQRCGDAQAKFVTIDKSQQQSITMRRLMRTKIRGPLCRACSAPHSHSLKMAIWDGAWMGSPATYSRTATKTCRNGFFFPRPCEGVFSARAHTSIHFNFFHTFRARIFIAHRFFGFVRNARHRRWVSNVL